MQLRATWREKNTIIATGLLAVRNLGKFTISGGENRRQRRGERSKSAWWCALSRLYLFVWSRRGVPEHPDIMLGYMHKAMALLLANPQLLDKIDSKMSVLYPASLPLNAMLYGNIYTMAARLTGPKSAWRWRLYNCWWKLSDTEYQVKKAIWNRGDAF